MDTVFVNGVTICYRSEGKGFPLIGITGKDSNMDWWHPAIRSALSENYRFIMLDNRGSGRSDAPTEPYGIADMARDVIGLMDALGIDKAYLLGQSMGGMIAQEMAIEFPERVAKLILCGTTCGVTRALPSIKMLKWMWRKPTGFSPQDTLDMLYPEAYMRANPEKAAALVQRMQGAPPNPVGMNMHKQASRAFDSFERLGRISAPALIVHGEEDWVFRPRHARILHRRIAGSRLVLIPGAGHGVMSQEPRKVLEEIRRFLD